jgi:hypothetical protein
MDGTLYSVGAEVYWNDPDEGIGSRYDTIAGVTSISKEGETTYMLVSGTEVFEYELE